MRIHALAAAALVLGGAPFAASAATFAANLTQLNGSGVDGFVTLDLDEAANRLTVNITASGLEPGMPHPQHIHGLLGGDSITPPDFADDDGDGFVELAEGLEFYGPIIVPLMPFPTAPDGTVNFTETYDLTDPSVFAGGFGIDTLLPLTDREIVLHGMTVAAGVGAGTPGEVDGTGGYLATLPVASGEIEAFDATPIPLPAAGLLLIGGVGALGGLTAIGRRKKA